MTLANRQLIPTNIPAPITVYFAIGMTEKSRLALLKAEGIKSVLFSYADVHSEQDLRRDLLAQFPDVLLDSGAYSVATSKTNKSKVNVNLQTYSLFIELYAKDRPGIQYIVLDDLSSWEQTVDNQVAMEKKGLHPIPVYHYGEPEAVLAHYCEEYPYVCLGGLAVGQMNWRKLKVFWEWVWSRYPKTRFHILGSNQFRAFTRVSPYSMDSTSWIADRWMSLMTIGEDGGPVLNQARLGRDDVQGHFFTVDELRSHNIRAMRYFGKMEWAKDWKDSDTKQGRLM